MKAQGLSWVTAQALPIGGPVQIVISSLNSLLSLGLFTFSSTPKTLLFFFWSIGRLTFWHRTLQWHRHIVVHRISVQTGERRNASCVRWRWGNNPRVRVTERSLKREQAITTTTRRREASSSSARCASWITTKVSATSTSPTTRNPSPISSLDSVTSSTTFDSSSKTLSLSPHNSLLGIASGAFSATPISSSSKVPLPGNRNSRFRASIFLVCVSKFKPVELLFEVFDSIVWRVVIVVVLMGFVT